MTRRSGRLLDARRSRDREPASGCSARRVRPHAAVARSRTVTVLLLGLALIPLVSGCSGASPETRAKQTRTALYGTVTPTSFQATGTAIAQGTFTGIDPENARMLTAEASLPVTSGTVRGTAIPAPRHVATHLAESLRDERRRDGFAAPAITPAAKKVNGDR